MHNIEELEIKYTNKLEKEEKYYNWLWSRTAVSW